ncbi:non-specific serine/threonine protein kinase [Ranunculus cassubicifolius]
MEMVETLESKYLLLKTGRKAGENSNVWDGVYQGKAVTLVEEDYGSVLEQYIVEDYVLRCLGQASTVAKDKHFSIRDPYACSLETFLKVKKENCDIHLPNVLKKADLLSAGWETNGYRHTPFPVKILRDVVQACYELRVNRLEHGDLTAKNVVLCVSKERIRAKVMRLKRGTTNDYADYQSLPKLVEDLFSSPKDETGYSYMSHEANDLWLHVQQMTVPNSNVDQREWREHQEISQENFLQDPRTLFKEPIFWSDDKCLQFFVRVRKVLQKCHKSQSYKTPQIQHFLSDIQAISQTDWFMELQDGNVAAVRAQLYDGAYAMYDGNKTEDLLSFIRNMLSHFEEKANDFKVAIGDIPHGFFEFFRSRYPNLLLETRRVLKIHLKTLQGYADVTDTFEEYI